jgi:hypothetical protein
MRRNQWLVLLALACMALVATAKDFVMPRADKATAYPAHDEHPAEHVAVAVDPYDTPEKAAIFKVNWRQNDYLPVFFVVTNDGNQPIALTGMKVELVTANRSKIQPATDDDLERRLSHLKHRPDDTGPLPLPIPKRKPTAGPSKQAQAEIDEAPFRALAVEPHGTHAGFLFFDIENISEPLAGAHLYVTGIKDNSGQELMFFEIPLDKYVPAPAQK